MPGLALSGQTTGFPGSRVLPETAALAVFPRPTRIWQRWRSLYDDILRHVRACDRLGIELTTERLADELDEAHGLVERRIDELCGLQLLERHRDGRVELGLGGRSADAG